VAHSLKPLYFQLSCTALALLAISLSSCGNAGRVSTVQASVAALETDNPKAELSRQLRAIQTRASFVMFAAHPDDEDGGTLVYETRKEGARGALFTITRGEGGQNAMSADLYDSLGLIRTQESLRSDQYYGVDQYFSRLVDYGFSKTPEEALEKWGHDRILSDAVRVVRTVRPLVILSQFLGAAVDGHGNHQVAGRIAQEAFLAAGDPNQFPEQIREGLRPWSPLKIYARLPAVQVTPRGIYDYAADRYVPLEFVNFISHTRSSALPPATLHIPEGDRAPESPLTYFQIAHAALSLQKSQAGEGTLPKAPFESAYYRLASRVAVPENETSFFDGIDSSVGGIASVSSKLAKLVADSATHDEKAPYLADALKTTRVLIEQTRASSLAEPSQSDILFELRIKEQQIEKALALALDTSLRATAEPNRDGSALIVATPGQTFQVEARVLNDGPEGLTVESLDIVPSDGKSWRIRSVASPARDLSAHAETESRVSISAPSDAKLTRPYFTRANEQQPYYDLIDDRLRNLPLTPYPLVARARLIYHGVPFELKRVVESAESPLLIGPEISLTVSPSVGALPISSTSFAFTCTVHSNGTGPEDGAVRLKLPQGWRSEPREARFSLTRYGEEQAIEFSIFPFEVKPGSYNIAATAYRKGLAFTEGYHMVGYQDLAPYPDYRSAEYRAVAFDVTTAPGLKIAFIVGTGDEVPKALASLGHTVTILNTDVLLTGDLAKYDAIVLGTRAYAVRTDLKSGNARLLDYVRNGGVLVVQYNLQNFDHNNGPFPFTLGSNPQKVVDENAPVRLLDPASPVFAWPNKITEADFQDWVEERGHGFLKSWDSRYIPLLEAHDHDQDPQKGGLLFARCGKGFYIYEAFALHRQLASGVPGAFRILANLVSLRKNPALNQ
jgi:LmbE family N-acetylglucosaminyl deacetylase